MDFGAFLLGEEDIVHLLFNGMKVDFGEKNKTHIGLLLELFPSNGQSRTALDKLLHFYLPFLVKEQLDVISCLI